MRTLLTGLFLLGLVGPADAARKSFDVMTLQVPKGWTAKAAKNALTLQSIDEKKGTFVLAIVGPSTASTGSLDGDFEAAWAGTIKGTFAVTDPPSKQPAAPKDGWDVTTGAARGTFNGVDAMVVLVTLTGHGRTMNVIAAMNDAALAPALDKLLASVVMKTPKGAPPVTAAAPAVAPAAPAAPAPAGGVFASTRFSDGWTANAEATWVRVTRGDVAVYLHFAQALGDDSRADIPGWFWDRLVAPRYRITRLNPVAYSELKFPYHYRTAEATDAAGRRVFVALRVVVASGIASPIEVVAPSEAALTAAFPTQDAIEAIQSANKFQITGALVGTWESSSSNAMNLVYVSTGGHAGTAVSAAHDTFTFGAGGVYKSQHKGVTGKIGSLQTFDVAYTGTFATSPWEIVVKRNDRTVTYDAYNEWTRQGALLHLRDKQYTGMAYTLGRR